MSATATHLEDFLNLAKCLYSDRDAHAFDSLLAVTRFDHIAFKLRVYLALLGMEQIDPDKMAESTGSFMLSGILCATFVRKLLGVAL